MERLIMILFICSLYLSTPIHGDDFVPSQVGTIRVSLDSISLDKGVLVSGSTSLLDDADQSGIVYREIKDVFAGL